MLMRLLLTTLALFSIISNTYAAAVEPSPAQLAINQSQVAVKIFQKACLLNYGATEDVPALLDKYFPRQADDKAKATLASLKIKKGTAWTATFPEGTYSIVQEPEGACHVIGFAGNTHALHMAVKVLATNAFRDLASNTVDYQARRREGVRDISGFNVNGFGDEALLEVSAVTSAIPQDGMPLITLSLLPK
jgi:hypothetical protein